MADRDDQPVPWRADPDAPARSAMLPSVERPKLRTASAPRASDATALREVRRALATLRAHDPERAATPRR